MPQAALNPTVPDGLVAALYKGTRPGLPGLYNRLGRRIGQGPYSHCELVMPDGDRTSWSSSFMDGGVRGKHVGYSSVGYWDFFILPKRYSAQQALDYFLDHDGWPYDLRGNLRFGIAIVVPSDNKQALFCSEAVGESIGLPSAFKLDPNSLADWLLYQGAQKVEVNAPT